MIEQNKQKKKVYLAAIAFTIIVGFSFLGVKTSVNVATPLETLTYRFNFAFLAALILPVFGAVKIDLSHKDKKGLLLSACCYLGFMILQTIGLLYASSIESGIIFACIPIFAKLIAHIVLGEKGTWVQTIFVTISVAALIAMFVLGARDFQGVSMKGLSILFLSSILMAVSNVAMRYARKEYKPYVISFVIAGLGCLIFNVATIAGGLFAGQGIDYFAPLVHPEFIVATAFLGIPSTLISALLMAYMLAHLEAVKATIFGNLSTAISITVGVLILGEPLYGYHIICTILIIIGVIGTSVSGKGPLQKSNSERSLH
ncbi:MAG: DMT family transporter [Eubacteriales bacterium]|nr:DMT family transporter [Eubacteriales bacterium]MDD3349603.1 DMT family transporter [Eubacteriales bacterium]